MVAMVAMVAMVVAMHFDYVWRSMAAEGMNGGYHLGFSMIPVCGCIYMVVSIFNNIVTPDLPVSMFKPNAVYS